MYSVKFLYQKGNWETHRSERKTGETQQARAREETISRPRANITPPTHLVRAPLHEL